MGTIKVTHNPDKSELEEMGVFGWPVWEHDQARFGWSYMAGETCYIFKGEAIVTPDGGDPVKISAGDLVVFPAGMDCDWVINKHIYKHYKSE